MLSKNKLCSIVLGTLLLTGCNSGGDSAQTVKSDFDFTPDLIKQLELRESFISESKLEYGGFEYRLSFSSEITDPEIGDMYMMKWESKDKGAPIENFILLLPEEFEGNDCLIVGHIGGYIIDKFDCSSIENVNEEIYNPKITADSGLDISFNIFEGSLSVGTTVLTHTENNGIHTITTSPGIEGVDSSDLGYSTYLQLKSIVDAIGSGNQDISVVFDSIIDGSIDDDINMHTGLLINNKGIKTVITKKGQVSSGGTDLFTAGSERVIYIDGSLDGKKVGVHSWAQGDTPATEIPYSDESHIKQATYFKTTLNGYGVPFYLYTLKSAPAKGMHYMSLEDLNKFNVTTEVIDTRKD